MLFCWEDLKIAEFFGNGLKGRLLQDDIEMLKEKVITADIKTIEMKPKRLLVMYNVFKLLF